jgi:serine protease Do
MEQTGRKLSTLVIAAALMLPVSLLAQNDQKERSKEKKDVEEIVIIRKNDSKEKVVVEINGDKITVNGKPIEDLKDGDVSVRRSKIKDVWAFADGLRASQGLYNMDHNGTYNFRALSVDSNRAMLGVTTETSDKGVKVEEITKGSAAEKAGLKANDVITKVGDKKIETSDDLTAAIKKQKPGDKVDVTYLRDGKEQKASAELGRWKGSNVFTTVPGQNFKMENFDFKFDDIMPRVNATPRAGQPYGQTYSRSNAPKLGLSVQDTDDGKGVKVLEVDEESNAAKAGLKENDIITEVDGKAVNSADEVAKIVRESKDKISLMLKLQRSGKTQNIELKIPRKLKTANL